MTEPIFSSGSSVPPPVSRATAQSVAKIKVGGVDYDYVYSKNCKVCNSPHRHFIEKALLTSRGYAAIIRSLPDQVQDPESPDHLTKRMIAYHVEAEHLPLRSAVVASIVKRRTEDLGLAIEDQTGTMLDWIVMGQTMMQRYYEAVAEGREIPSGSEVVAVMRMFREMETEQKIDTKVYNQVFALMIDSVRKLAPEAYDKIMFQVSTNPLVRSLVEEQQRQRELGSARIV